MTKEHSMLSPLRIGIAGLGTVGCGTLIVLQRNAELLAARTGRRLDVVAVSMRDMAKPREGDLAGIRVTPDALSLATAGDIDVVVELIGGAEGIARTLVESALAHGKHVVTANKALIARHGAALAACAEAQQVTLAFEAAVAGGIPILAGLRQGLAANRITQVAGILNGTCNYILTTMQQSRRDFAEVLAEAQALGYAEADPAADIDGHDTAHKLAILASLAFGTSPALDAVACAGIRAVTLADIDAAEGFGYRIKLLGLASFGAQGLRQSVQPCLVPLTAPLAAVHGSFNAVEVEADAAGRVVFEGRGAGAAPTASAVISDLMAIARGEHSSPFGIPHARLATPSIAPSADQTGRYYLRLTLRDAPGALADITRVFAQEQVSVHSITQRTLASDASAQVIVITHATTHAAITHARDAIHALAVNLADPLVLPIKG